MRSPPQTLLLSEPTEITVSAKEASGGGTCTPGNPRSPSTSSSTSGTPAAAAAAASACRASGGSTEPVGLWKVEIT